MLASVPWTSKQRSKTESNAASKRASKYVFVDSANKYHKSDRRYGPWWHLTELFVGGRLCMWLRYDRVAPCAAMRPCSGVTSASVCALLGGFVVTLRYARCREHL